MINPTINGKVTQVAERTMILEAGEALDIKIPALCFHPLPKLCGASRQCVVDGKRGMGYKRVTARKAPCQDGTTAITDSGHDLGGAAVPEVRPGVYPAQVKRGSGRGKR